MTKEYLDRTLLPALEKEGQGIPPKVRMALTFLVEHVGELERATERLERRCAQLEKLAHAPSPRPQSDMAATRWLTHWSGQPAIECERASRDCAANRAYLSADPRLVDCRTCVEQLETIGVLTRRARR